MFPEKLFKLALFLTLLILNCKSSQKYKLSEALPNYAEYEGKSVDPLLDEPVQIPDTEIEKYNFFFKRAKLIVIRIRIAKKLTDNSDHSDINQKKLALSLLTELPEIAKEAELILKEGKELMENAQADFTGMNAVKLPGILSEFAVTSKELASGISDLPVILSNIANLNQSPGKAGVPIAALQKNRDDSSVSDSMIYTKFTSKQDTQNRLTRSLEKLRKIQKDLEQIK